MTRVHFVFRMAAREARASGRRLLLLTGAISVGVAALVAISSFTDNLRNAVEGQSRALLGSDLSFTTRTRPDSTLDRLLDSLAGSAGASRAAVLGFSGMAYVPRTSGVRLVEVTAISGGYPFYGAVHTEPAGAWSRLATDRVALVDPSFLTALNAVVGDTMALGEVRLPIVGTVTGFPGDVAIRSAFGPRVFVPGGILPETGLITFGSRVAYAFHFRVPGSGEMRTLAEQWRTRLGHGAGRLRTAADDERNLKRFFDQLGRYLGLVALVALLIGGIGVASAIGVFLRQRRPSIAVLRCLGATSGQVFAIYLLQTAVLGLAGSLLGVGLGLLLQLALPAVLGEFLPLDVAVRPSPAAMLTGVGVGLWVALIFALLPLLSVRSVPPLAVLRRDVEPGSSWRDLWSWAARVALAASVVLLAAFQVSSPLRGLAFSAGVGTAVGVLWLAALGLTRALRRWFPRRLGYVQRQGLANLYRPANQTVPVVLALGFGAFLLGSLAVLERSLLTQLALDGGVGRPNLVFFDVQPDQRDPVAGLIGQAGLPLQPMVPIVPMRLRALNGIATATLVEDSTRRPSRDGDRPERWALRREYRSTYRDSTVGSEKLLVGDWWAPGRTYAPGTPIPLSLETGIASDLGVTVRDTITWDLQGVPLTTVVVNLREVNWARFEPNFFAVFPNGVLEQAPQTFVLLTRADDPVAVGALQRRMAEGFPNVTSIDLTSVQRTIERIVGSVALAVRFMALLTLATGVVVLIGALATSRFQRLREAALLKTLGATRRQVLGVQVTEYAALGLLAGMVGLGLACLAGWSLTHWIFEIPLALPGAGFGLVLLLLLALPVLAGVWNSAEIFRRTPLDVLRAE